MCLNKAYLFTKDYLPACNVEAHTLICFSFYHYPAPGILVLEPVMLASCLEIQPPLGRLSETQEGFSALEENSILVFAGKKLELTQMVSLIHHSHSSFVLPVVIF